MWTFVKDGVKYVYNDNNRHLYEEGMELILEQNEEELNEICRIIASIPLDDEQRSYVPYNEEEGW